MLRKGIVLVNGFEALNMPNAAIWDLCLLSTLPLMQVEVRVQFAMF